MPGRECRSWWLTTYRADRRRVIAPKSLLLLPDGRDPLGWNVGTNMDTLVPAAHAGAPDLRGAVAGWCECGGFEPRTSGLHFGCPVRRFRSPVNACMRRFT